MAPGEERKWARPGEWVRGEDLYATCIGLVVWVTAGSAGARPGIPGGACRWARGGLALGDLVAAGLFSGVEGAIGGLHSVGSGVEGSNRGDPDGPVIESVVSPVSI